mmetsp:Transcript_69011/g.113149  ORF Transcript_69011/g.113149 Transcript_69011/m.113149 type:complete len:240 (+) Transcript_69011:1395-2114(+)
MILARFSGFLSLFCSLLELFGLIFQSCLQSFRGFSLPGPELLLLALQDGQADIQQALLHVHQSSQFHEGLDKLLRRHDLQQWDRFLNVLDHRLPSIGSFDQRLQVRVNACVEAAWAHMHETCGHSSVVLLRSTENGLSLGCSLTHIRSIAIRQEHHEDFGKLGVTLHALLNLLPGRQKGSGTAASFSLQLVCELGGYWSCLHKTLCHVVETHKAHLVLRASMHTNSTEVFDCLGRQSEN